MALLSELLDIGPARRNKLRESGIVRPSDLLRQCRTSRSRRRFHDFTGLGPDQLLDWALTADLLRLPGVDAERARLLRAAGVEGVVALRYRRADYLAWRLWQLAPQRPPVPVRRVRAWIASARELPTVVFY